MMRRRYVVEARGGEPPQFEFWERTAPERLGIGESDINIVSCVRIAPLRIPTAASSDDPPAKGKSVIVHLDSRPDGHRLHTAICASLRRGTLPSVPFPVTLSSAHEAIWRALLPPGEATDSTLAPPS
ncbi:hypothetical protein MUK42_34404 [Musa troglodytarum]|uniref:Uncharacterized protein n=1 Tax=Musa troglodytarum TaxID=320322 RepID=A0A9E7K4J0_9LILI|nr:hypothetical protein MUK42_34404 [Musa troglodytarum]